MDERLLTVAEAAEYLRLRPGAIYQMRYRGEAPATLAVKVGRKLLFRPSDIHRWMDGQQAPREAVL